MNIEDSYSSFIREKIDTKRFEDLLRRGDFVSVIKNKELFWGQFCRTFAAKKIEKSDIYFDITLKSNQVHMVGREHIVSEVKEIVEEYRKLIEKAIDKKKSITRLWIEGASELYLRKVSDKAIDLNISRGEKGKFTDHFYYKRVKPYLGDFLDSLKVSYSTLSVKHLIDNGYGPFVKPCERFTLTPHSAIGPVYPVKPATMPVSTHPANAVYYQHYKEKKYCDIALESQTDGATFPLHALVLDVHGGPFFKHCLANEMKESQEKVIKLEGSKESIELFLEYLYLGPGHLEQLMLSKQDTDIWSLMTFAHIYEITPLFKLCVNMVMLSASAHNLGDLELALKTYDDPDLKRLVEFWRSQSASRSS